MVQHSGCAMWQAFVLLLAAASLVPAAAASPYYGYGSRRLQTYGGYYRGQAARRLAALPARPTLLGASARRLFGVWEAAAVPLPTHLSGGAVRTLAGYGGGYYGTTRRLSSYYYGAGTHRRLQSLQPTGHGRQLSGYYGYGPAAPGRRLMSVAAAAGRTLASYGYYGSTRRLSSYYYGGASHRRLQSVGAGLGLGRGLASYGGYYGGASHRRLQSAGAGLGRGRGLASYGGYYGGASHRRLQSAGRRPLTSYYYGGAHRL